jgi:membrane protease YdiL (CAAX protease family)
MVAGGLAVFALTARVLSRAEGGLRSIGWCRASSREVWLSITGGVLVAALYLLVVTQIYPPAAGQKWGPLATAATSGGWQRGFWVLIVLVAAPIEEFLFRGVLWTGLRRSFGAAIAAGLVTVLFVAGHATEALGYWPAWLVISVMGAGTLVQRARTDSLIPPVALHAAYNASLAVITYLGAA